MNVLDMFRLNGRTAIVTGGAGRYGKQIVEALGEAGATVFIASRDLGKCEETAAKFRAAGLDVRALQLDLAEKASIDRMISAAVGITGRIDILVNNAVTRSACTGWEQDLENYDVSLHVNASSMFYITAAVARVMQKQHSGSIINIGSFMGLVGPEFANYEGTDMGKDPSPIYFYEKGGMVNFTRWAASVLGRDNIRVNAIHPGGLQESHLPEAFVKNYSARTQLGRLANQEDLKGIMVFLASDASSYLTGTNIPVDGGYTAK
ncbi:MAG: SDR family oxidoreductase [Lentisphaeria bacterium]|nr:SDR family oxidoreductase [Lentisphaeria bacterium]